MNITDTRSYFSKYFGHAKFELKWFYHQVFEMSQRKIEKVVLGCIRLDIMPQIIFFSAIWLQYLKVLILSLKIFFYIFFYEGLPFTHYPAVQ